MSNIKNFILDVDGVMTSGKFLYSTKGKIYKEFGAHDSDGLKILSKYINIEFITADRRGLGISKSRISKDMGFKLTLVPEEKIDMNFLKPNLVLKILYTWQMEFMMQKS